MKNMNHIIWLEEVDSTNEEAKRRINDIDNLSVLSARKQTAGRGQRGNSWISEPGANLTFSIILKFSDGKASGMHRFPAIRAVDQFAVTELASLSIIDLLAGHGIKARIKWPNDIYVGNSKICGILIENSVRGDYLSTSITGIGLNVMQKEFSPSLPNPVSLACLNSQVKPELLLEEFMEIFKGYSRRYLNITGGLARLRRLYLAQLWKINENSRFIDYTTLPAGHFDGPMQTFMPSEGSGPAREFSGIIRGISEVGNLLVEDCTTGAVREFGFKEIGYILQ